MRAGLLLLPVLQALVLVELHLPLQVALPVVLGHALYPLRGEGLHGNDADVHHGAGSRGLAPDGHPEKQSVVNLAFL